MNIDEFRGMRRGIQLFTLNKQDRSLMTAIEKKTKNKDRALFLIHGYSSTPAVFRLIEPSLANYYDAIFCPILVGHAENIDAFAKAKAEDWLLQVEQIYENLTKHYQQVEVMGLSLGGLLACHLSQRFNLPHLYLLAPAVDVFFPLKKCIMLAKVLNWLGFTKIRSAAGDLHSNDHFEIAYRQLPLASIIEILTLIQTFQFTPPGCPTDLFLGRYDKVVSSELVESRFLGRSNINIHWLANSAHVLPLDGDIETIINCVKQNQTLSSRPVALS